MKIAKSCIIFLVIWLTNALSAQVAILDSITKEPLAFASVINISTNSMEATTDENGVFNATPNMYGKTYKISYIGYNTVKFVITSTLKVVYVSQMYSELNEIVIKPDESPAIKLIKNVLKHLDETDVAKLPYYQCREYSKTIFGFDVVKDSVDLDFKFKKVAVPSNMIIAESVTEKNYQYKGKSFNTVIATKISGLENPQYATTSEDMQPFHFYTDHIQLYGKDYIHPISSLSWLKYTFNIESEYPQGGDTLTRINFWPQSPAYNCFVGYMIISKKYNGLLEVHLESPKTEIYPFIIDRVFVPIGKTLFPAKLSSSFKYPSILDKNQNFKLDQLSVFDSVRFEKIDIKAIKNNNTVLAPEASLVTEDEMAKYRKIELDTKDSVAYSFGKYFLGKTQVGILLNNMEYFMQKRLPIKMVNLDITSIFKANAYEGKRWGLGLYTNRVLFENIELGGYIAKGINDQKWKYGTSASYFFDKIRMQSISYNFYSDVFPSTSYNFRNDFFNKLISDYWTKNIRHELVAKNIIGNLRFTNRITKDQITPLYDYKYTLKDDSERKEFNLAELQSEIEYFKAKKYLFFNTYYSVRDVYKPYVKFNFRAGFNKILGGEVPYASTELTISQYFKWKILGASNIIVQGGKILGNVPLFRIYQTPASRLGNVTSAIGASFQTMKPNEYFSDQYFHAFIEHNFGKLYSTKFSRPELTLIYNMGYGKLARPEVHQFVTIKDYPRGYHEAGFGINNLIRIPVKNWFAIGLRGGLMYPLFDHFSKDFKNTYVLKLGIGFAY